MFDDGLCVDVSGFFLKRIGYVCFILIVKDSVVLGKSYDSVFFKLN